MENENKEILNKNQELSDDEIEEVSGGLAINTTLKPNENSLSQASNQKFG